jgi:hypothetical protein
LALIGPEKLGQLLQRWEPDPYVGPMLASGRGSELEHDAVERARDMIREQLARVRKAKGSRGYPGGTGARGRDEAELSKIERGLDDLLHTYRYGELPEFGDFRTHLRLAHDAQGRPIAGRPPLVFQFTARGRPADAALEAVDLTEGRRGLRVVLQPEGRVQITIGSYRTLYNYLLALALIRGRAAMKLGRRLAGSLGIRWV